MPVTASMMLVVACTKKDVPVSQENSETSGGLKVTGALADDPQKVASVPVFVSSEFAKMQTVIAAKGGKPALSKDSDGDGIADSNDACPTQPETFNGYQDTDGCPDTAPAPSSSDATAPTVSITSPANGATVSGTVSVSVNAADNVAVTSVSYSVDGVAIASSTTAPFGISWDVSNLADGLHTLAARAYDGAGNNSVSSISVSKSTTVMPSPVLPSTVTLAMPPVSYQGSEGSCVAFAVAYAARSCEQFYRTKASGYSLSTNVFSPEYVFNQTQAGGCSSSSLLTALDLVVNKGVCTWSTMPYDYNNGCSLQPTSSQNSEAAGFKIASYARAYTSDVTAIKTLLSNKHPLMMGFANDNNFNKAGPGYIWKSYDYSGGFGSHAITICGYDDAKHAYLAINSWGTAWGSNGYIWIDYDFLPTVASSVYFMN